MLEIQFFFYKFFYKLLILWVIIGKLKKNDVISEPIWELVRSWIVDHNSNL